MLVMYYSSESVLKMLKYCLVSCEQKAVRKNISYTT